MLSIHAKQMSVKASMFISLARSCFSMSPILAGRRSLAVRGLTTDNPPHGGIWSETACVVYIFAAAKASNCRPTKLSRYAVPSVLAGPVILEGIPRNLGQAKDVNKLLIGQ